MRAFITGVTGTLGQEVSTILLQKGFEIIGFSRDEFKQKQMPARRNQLLVLGDVRDRNRVLEATRGCDIIFHFAALKHVDVMEENPEECIATNVVGTENILHAQRIHKIPRVCLSSTDKAAYPINVYGFCKALSERLVLRNQNNVVCRYGNVLASRGSVIPQFIKTLKEKKRVFLTDEQMTRFFIRIQDAAGFVVSSGLGESGGLKIPKMKACSMKFLAQCLADLLGINQFTFEVIGTRPGEKYHECLQTYFEGQNVFSDTAEQFTAEELKGLLAPIVEESL